MSLAATISEGGISILSRLPVSWRGLGAVLFGILLARWSWIFFAPQAVAVPIIPDRGPAPETGRLFGQAASGVTSTQGIALSNVKLVGVFAASAGKPGFAILQLEGKRQVGVVVGGVVVPGTTLFEVHPEHVLLESGGIQQRVSLAGVQPGAQSGNMENNKEREPTWGIPDSSPNMPGQKPIVPEKNRSGAATLGNARVPDSAKVPDREMNEKSYVPASGVMPKIGMPR